MDCVLVKGKKLARIIKKAEAIAAENLTNSSAFQEL
jgi:hypothetical protein